MKHAVALTALIALPAIGHAHCYKEAAERYQLNPELLEAIAYVESRGRPEATNLGHLSRTKTYDIGVMQINSSWLRKLTGFGITEQMLRDPCQNVMVGAWILSNHMNEDGSDWRGVGAYNASCRTLSTDRCNAARGDYTWKVYRALLRKRGDAPALLAQAARATPRRKLSDGQTLANAVMTKEPAQSGPASARRISSIYVENDVSTTRIPVIAATDDNPAVTGAVWRDKSAAEFVASRSDHHGDSN